MDWNDALKVKFIRLYKVSFRKEFAINMGWYEGEVWRWTLSWTKRLSLKEKQDEEVLFNILQLHYPRRYQDNKITWCNNIEFSVKRLVSKAISTIV